MNSKSFVVLLLAVVLGSVSAGVTVALLTGVDTPPPADEVSVEVADAEYDSDFELRAQVQALRVEVELLGDRLAELEDRPTPTLRTPVEDTVSAAEFEALRAQVQNLTSPQEGEAPPTELKNQVAEALAAVRKDETTEYVERMHEKRRAMLEQDLAGLQEWLGLSANQVNEMRTALTARYERDQEVIRLWKEGTADEVLGAIKQSNQAEHQSTLERVLTAQQLSTYQAKMGGGAEK